MRGLWQTGEYSAKPGLYVSVGVRRAGRPLSELRDSHVPGLRGAHGGCDVSEWETLLGRQVSELRSNSCALRAQRWLPLPSCMRWSRTQFCAPLPNRGRSLELCLLDDKVCYRLPSCGKEMGQNGGRAAPPKRSAGRSCDSSTAFGLQRLTCKLNQWSVPLIWPLTYEARAEG